ncbi:hypothetical protein AVL62_10930 [Serinicoccus chungangensis]|uniref:Rieske domain-containing protein n=1 Tax=Serinicoccus chungangensis TaxID=767452 RepID=A0A0W8IEU4_9MICO|nr:hypothetical protein AVL62_10930 [Serinicoccus chungangensis]
MVTVTSTRCSSTDLWTPVCRRDQLAPGWGEAALLGDTQVALFLVVEQVGCAGRVYAVSNLDPATGAAVISRGIVGSRSGCPTIASPLHKDVFDLSTGDCLTRTDLRLPVWAVREVDGLIELAPGKG